MLHRMIPKPPLPPSVPLTPEHICSKAPTTPSSSPSVTVPSVAKVSRVIPPTKQHLHTVLKHRANSQVQVQPAANSLIKRLLHIYNKQTGKKKH